HPEHFGITEVWRCRATNCEEIPVLQRIRRRMLVQKVRRVGTSSAPRYVWLLDHRGIETNASRRWRVRRSRDDIRKCCQTCYRDGVLTVVGRLLCASYANCIFGLQAVWQ